MLVVTALGGNALLRRGELTDVATQRGHVGTAVEAIAAVAAEHELVVTHGNGPQVGLLALQGEAYADADPFPLDVLGAETEGMIGYLLDRELVNELGDARVATLLTQVVVDAGDPAFERPTKPIGPVFDAETAARLAASRGWTLAPDGGGRRRVVASPEPRAIVELPTLRLLVEAGVIVVCVGGGGIPVTLDDHGRLRGAEAVIDKDLAAALLARELEADALLLLTDVPAVEVSWGAPGARPLGEVTSAELRGLDFEPGSMGPKVEAACRFVEATGAMAGIGALGDAAAILRGERGTRVSRRQARTRSQPRNVKESREVVLRRRLADERSGKVAFVSHCLLNENTRYLGGAFHAGAVPELIDELVQAGVGISQLPCPEQRAWGGVLKRLLLRVHGIKGSPLYLMRRPLLRLWVAYTALAYTRLARQVVREIEDYQRSGFEVVGVIGVGSSPSCGVDNTLDMRRSLEVIAACPVATINRSIMNEQAVAGCQRAGEGIFTRRLKRRLGRRGLSVPFFEYDIVAEMRGEPQHTVETLLEQPGPR